MTIPRVIEDFLEEIGCDYEIIDGGKHNKLYVEGKFCTALSKGARAQGGGPVGHWNVISAIKRTIREVQNGANQAAQNSRTESQRSFPH